LSICTRSLVLSICALATLSACDSRSGEAEQGGTGNIVANDEKAGKSGLSGELDISKRGTPAPDVQFEDPDGMAVTLADFRGKPVLVNLWATWCGPCVEEMPTLDALAMREKDRLHVLTVSQDLEGATKVDPFFKKADFQMIGPYLDPENGLNFSFKTGLMPTTVLFDAEGKEVWRMLGGMDWNGSRASALLEETLTNPAG